MLPRRDEFFRQVGLGKTQVRVVYGVLGIMAVAMVAQGVERWHNARTLGTQVYVVVTDPSGALAQAAVATHDWHPGDGVWLYAAQEWLRNVRARPTDPDTWKWQAGRIKATTNRELYVSVNDWLVRSRKDNRGNGVDVEILESSLIPETVTAQSATARIVWQERRRGQAGVGDWLQCHVLISMTRKPPEDSKEVLDNPLSLWVTDYSHSCHEAPTAIQRKAEAQ